MLNNVPQYQASPFSRGLQLNAVETFPFSNVAQTTDRCQAGRITRYKDNQGHALGLVPLPFGIFGEVNQLCI